MHFFPDLAEIPTGIPIASAICGGKAGERQATPLCASRSGGAPAVSFHAAFRLQKSDANFGRIGGVSGPPAI
jgi:hypothetical protein